MYLLRRPSSTSSCRVSGATSPSHSVMLPSNCGQTCKHGTYTLYIHCTYMYMYCTYTHSNGYLDTAPELLVVEECPRRETVLDLGPGVQGDEHIFFCCSPQATQDSCKQGLCVPTSPRHCRVVLCQLSDEGCECLSLSGGERIPDTLDQGWGRGHGNGTLTWRPNGVCEVS